MAGNDNEEDSSHFKPPSSPPHNISPTLTYVTKFKQNTKGEFQMHLNSVPVTALADSGSARSLISSQVLALVKGEFYLNYLEKKAFRPIHDANSKPLKILGAIQLDIRIEKFTAQAEFLCYHGTNNTVLLGFMTLHKENLVVYPRLGLFSCSQATDEIGDACFLAASEKNVDMTVEGQQLLLPVAACCHHTIPPGGSVNIPAQIILPSLGEKNKECFIYSTFVFSSEQLQKEVPLHRISIYYQYQTLSCDLKVTLRFVNHFKTEQIIYPGEVIAHAQELQECPDEQIKQSEDDIMKYIHSIFKPDLQEASNDNDERGVDDEKGKESKMSYAPGDANKSVPSGVTKFAKRASEPEPLSMHTRPQVRRFADSEKALHLASPSGGNNKEPSLITSHTSAPFTYTTGLHELKGPEELEGSYSLADVKIESTDPDEISFIHRMYTTYKDAVSQHEYDAGEYCGDKLTFTLKKGTQSYHAKAFPIPRHLKPQADALINQLLSAGIIGKSTTPAHIISQLHFVQKAWPDLPPDKARYAGEKDTSKPRKIRAVINHKVLNSAVNLPTRFPQPTIPEVLRKMHSATVASCTDLRAAFYSIRVHPTVFPFLAFEYCNELLYFKAAPMGFVLSSFALAAATQYMKLRHGLTQCDFIADDCIIYGESAADYQAQVEKFFIALKATGFKLHPLKTSWFCRGDLPVLGFILNLPSRSLLASPQKIKGIMSMAQPRSKRDIKRFIGAISFLSQFIFGLQQLLRPLHTAASPKPPFAWTSECNESWLTIRRSLAALPCLRLPSPRYPLQVHCDSSPNVSRALNWVFTQRQGGNRSYLIQFGSKCLSPQHWALSQPELELLGLCCSLKTDSHLVSYTSLDVITDARGLTFLSVYENSQSKLRRWKLFLESLPITIRFRNNTEGLIRVVDMIGRSRQQVVQALKIKKPMAKDNMVFPVYNFEHVQDLPFHHCMALIKSIVDLQRLANLSDGYPLMPDLTGTWLPLAGMLLPDASRAGRLSNAHQQPPPLRHAAVSPTGATRSGQRALHFVPAAKCRPSHLPAPASGSSTKPDLAAAALTTHTECGVQKAKEWACRHWANDKLTPRPPTLPTTSAYALSMVDNRRHHLPSIPHKSVYTNPTSRGAKGPLLLHKYEIHNLHSDEKEPALRFLLMVNSELKGFPLASVRKEQQEDQSLEPIMAQLKQGRPVKGYALFNGLLLCIQKQPGLKITLVLPKALGTKYLAYVHESTTLFHIGAKDLIKMSSRYFSMTHLSKIAKQVTDECAQCQAFNVQQHRAAVRGRRFLVSRPRQMLHCDVCSFFTGKENKSYMVVVDIFSYLTNVYVLKSPETAQQLAGHLLHHFSSHSVPAGICLDNAKVHEGVLSQALALLNVRKFQPSARVPAPNFVERVNSYLLQKIRLLYASFQISDEQLPCLVSLATHIFNCTPLKSLDNNAPYSLHFGEGASGIAHIPTVCVSDSSPLPPYIKALARLQTNMWDSINALRRAREATYRQGNDPRRKPMFRAGDYVRMRADPDLTAKHHKIAPKYKPDIFKCIKVLPHSGNYILLRMNHANQLRYGFFSKVGVPKKALVYAKESRLKRSGLRVASRDPLGAKLLALFVDVALKEYPTPKDFEFCPQVGKTFAVDRKLQKLTNFVLNREIPCPPRLPPLIEKRLRDSELGDIFPPSDDGGRAGDKTELPFPRSNPSISHYRLVPAPPPPLYETIVRRVLPQDLAELHLAAGCKPYNDDGNDDEDGDSHAEERAQVRRQQHQPPAGQTGRMTRAAAAAARQSNQPQGNNGRQEPPPKEQINAARIQMDPLLQPAQPGQESRQSPVSSISSTGAVNLNWDPTFDFLQPAALHPVSPSREMRIQPGAKDQVTASLQNAAPHTRPSRRKLRLLFGTANNIDEDKDGSGDARSYNEEEGDENAALGSGQEDFEEFYDAGEIHSSYGSEEESTPDDNLLPADPPTARNIPAGAADRLGSPQGSSPEARGAAGQGQSPSTLMPPVRLPNLKLAYSHCDENIKDLPLPRAPLTLHGPQVFSNDGILQPDLLLQSSSSKSAKKTVTKPVKKSSAVSMPPSPHPKRTRPVSERLTKSKI